MHTLMITAAAPHPCVDHAAIVPKLSAARALEGLGSESKFCIYPLLQLSIGSLLFLHALLREHTRFSPFAPSRTVHQSCASHLYPTLPWW